MTEKPRGPLEGVRVIDLTSVMLGPFATMMLGEMGAEVIKIEPPGGDIGRWTGAAKTPGMSAPASARFFRWAATISWYRATSSSSPVTM